MKYSEYLPLARATECKYSGADIKIDCLANFNGARLVHLALGLTTEALELLEARALNKSMDQKLMELSDILWFSALACHELGQTITDDEVINNQHPLQPIHVLAANCELFGSRVKAAIAYGSPVKPSDPAPGFWQTIPKSVFLHACRLGDNQLRKPGALMDMNIKKLRARYPAGEFDRLSATVRNEKQEEIAAVVNPNPELKIDPTVAAALKAAQALTPVA